MSVKYDTARQLSTVNICLNQFAINASVFVNSMDFTRRYKFLRRIIYVYVCKYKHVIFCKIRAEFYLFNQSCINFDLQIGATDILVRPNFDCRS